MEDEQTQEALIAELRAQLQAERERSAAELARCRAQYQRLAEASFEGLFIHDQGVILEANQAGAAMLGYAREELVGRPILDLAAPDSHAAILAHVRSGSTEPYEARGVRRDGSLIEAELQGKTIDYQGRPARVTAIRDITERKRMEQALRQGEEQWRTLVDNAPSLILVADLGGAVRFLNRGVLSPDPEDSLGHNIFEFVPPADQPRIRGILAQVAATGRPTSYESQGYFPDGQPKWFQINVGPLRQNGAIAGFLIIANDITSLKATEEALRKNELFLARAQELAHMGCWEWNIVAGTEIWSDELYRLYGVDPATFETTYAHFLEIVHPDDREQVMGHIRQALEDGQSFVQEFRIVRPDGAQRIIYSRSEVILDQAGRPVRMMGVNQDITELKQAYEQIALRTAELKKARELDALKSNFVNAVTHELRTPLTSIKGYAEFLEDQIAGPLSPQQLEFVRELELGATRLERLVDDLLDFARIDAGTFKVRIADADLTAKLREAVGSLEPQAREARLALRLEVPDAPLVVPMDAQRIGQVLINLVHNAIKFTPSGGTITVRACVEGDHVRTEVADNGIGIAAEDQPKLFQRFSQLESGVRTGGGTGLGLSISKTIIEAHHGAIGVESEPGKGSTFWFTLPLKHRTIAEPPIE